MSYMFSSCKTPTVDISSFETKDDIDFKSMFENCKSKIKAKDKRILYVYYKFLQDSNMVMPS